MRWTDDMQALLVKFAYEGKSFQDVADELGLTRSSVAGRANRMGVPFRGIPGTRGERHGFAKLTESDVRWLRDAQWGEIAERAAGLGITPGTAYAVRGRRLWAHVP